MHSDQDRNYESEVFQELCELLEIRKTRTSPKNPKGNGQIKRFNRTHDKILFERYFTLIISVLI
jgi:transposase InsO family protein